MDGCDVAVVLVNSLESNENVLDSSGKYHGLSILIILCIYMYQKTSVLDFNFQWELSFEKSNYNCTRIRELDNSSYFSTIFLLKFNLK